MGFMFLPPWIKAKLAVLTHRVWWRWHYVTSETRSENARIRLSHCQEAKSHGEAPRRCSGKQLRLLSHFYSNTRHVSKPSLQKIPGPVIELLLAFTFSSDTSDLLEPRGAGWWISEAPFIFLFGWESNSFPSLMPLSEECITQCLAREILTACTLKVEVISHTPPFCMAGLHNSRAMLSYLWINHLYPSGFRVVMLSVWVPAKMKRQEESPCNVLFQLVSWNSKTDI